MAGGEVDLPPLLMLVICPFGALFLMKASRAGQVLDVTRCFPVQLAHFTVPVGFLQFSAWCGPAQMEHLGCLLHLLSPLLECPIARQLSQTGGRFLPCFGL